MESDGQADLPEQRVQRRLADLGADTASAPDVPAGVTARVGAALALAAPPAHAVTRKRPRLGRLQLIAVVVGVGAATAGVALGATTLRQCAADADIPRRPDR